MTLIYLDTETTGLDPDRHEVWEIAYAVDDGPVLSRIVWHELRGPDATALRVGGHVEPGDHTAAGDVRALRECHLILRDRYARMRSE